MNKKETLKWILNNDTTELKCSKCAFSPVLTKLLSINSNTFSCKEQFCLDKQLAKTKLKEIENLEEILSMN